VPLEEEQLFTRRVSSRTSTTIADEQPITRRGGRVTTAAPVVEEEKVFTRRGGRVTTPAPAPVEEEEEDEAPPPQLFNGRRPETTREVDEEEGTVPIIYQKA